MFLTSNFQSSVNVFLSDSVCVCVNILIWSCSFAAHTYTSVCPSCVVLPLVFTTGMYPPAWRVCLSVFESVSCSSVCVKVCYCVRVKVCVCVFALFFILFFLFFLILIFFFFRVFTSPRRAAPGHRPRRRSRADRWSSTSGWSIQNRPEIRCESICRYPRA